MAHVILMPAVGQVSDEFTIVAWLKAEGEAVAAGEPLFSVETDKATLEIEAAYAGMVLKIVHPAQSVVHTGDALVVIGAPGEPIPALTAPQAPVTSAPAAPLPPLMPSVPPATEGKVLAVPAARQLAREHGVDLNALRGSGPGGRIEREDVQRAIDARQ